MTEVEQAERFLEIETQAVSRPLPEWLGWTLCLVSTAVPILIYFVTR
jgi:hypothetical protein